MIRWRRGRWRATAADGGGAAAPAWTAAVATVVALVLAWPLETPYVAAGLDPSHRAAMHMAAERGMRYGPEIVFTYGPLGWLTSPVPYYPGRVLVAAAFSVILMGGALHLVARRAARRLPPPGVVAVTLLAALALVLQVRSQAHAEVLALVVALVALDWVRSEPRSRDLAVPVGLGALSGFALLIKLSGGVAALLVAATAGVVRCLRHGGERPGLDLAGLVRVAAASGAGFSASLLVLWVLARQRVVDLPTFLVASGEIVAGYTEAMSYHDPRRRWTLWAGFLMVTLLLGLAGVAGRRRAPAVQYGALAVLAAAVLPLVKQGYVRHAGFYLFPGVALLTAALWRRARPVPIVGLLALSTTLTWLVLGSSPVAAGRLLLDGPDRVVRTARQYGPGRQQAAEDGRRALRASYALAEPGLERITGRTVHVDPWEATLAWAYPELRWDPAPVFQSYSAYTDRLDRMNSEFLASTRAPEYILQERISMDYRNPRFESPGYVLEKMCRYWDEGKVSPTYHLLHRGESRCGAPAPLGPRAGAFGEWVPVPPAGADRIVVARIAVERRPADAVRSLLYKGPPMYFEVPGQRYRFLAGHSSQPHVLQVPACLGWAPELLDPQPYPEFRLTGDGWGERGFSVEFAEIPFRCPAPSPWAGPAVNGWWPTAAPPRTGPPAAAGRHGPGGRWSPAAAGGSRPARPTAGGGR